jgi:F-type H+-transporting ATPase subunit alpha
MLKQPQYKPMPVEQQVVIIYAATHQYLLDIETSRVLDFERGLFEYIDTKEPDIFANIRDEKVISEETEKLLIQAIEAFKKEF